MHLAVAFVYAVGSVICHQRPERSFFWAGYQLPVCARCTGLYVSAGVAMVVWWVARLIRRSGPAPFTSASALRTVALAGAPTALSWIAGVLGVWDGSNLTRALLAIPLGCAAGVVVAAVSTKDLR